MRAHYSAAWILDAVTQGAERLPVEAIAKPTRKEGGLPRTLRCLRVAYVRRRRRSLQRVLQRHAGCVMHMSADTCPGAQDAVSPGRQLIAHEAHAPTAGVLQDAPVSVFFFEAV